jgi:hypothetical protein
MHHHCLDNQAGVAARASNLSNGVFLSFHHLYTKLSLHSQSTINTYVVLCDNGFT